MTKDDGGPAFPTEGRVLNPSMGELGWPAAPGMSLRDWFATFANETEIAIAKAAILQRLGREATVYEARYLHADCMLEYRKK